MRVGISHYLSRFVCGFVVWILNLYKKKVEHYQLKKNKEQKDSQIAPKYPAQR
jgi:hypothetical protein